MADLRIKIGSLEFRNPVILASGTCGYGAELEDFIDMSQLGGIIVKGTTLEPREGNAYPRMAETASGMLNAVGLQNKGIDYFEKHIYPLLARYDTHVIVITSYSIHYTKLYEYPIPPWYTRRRKSRRAKIGAQPWTARTYHWPTAGPNVAGSTASARWRRSGWTDIRMAT